MTRLIGRLGVLCLLFLCVTALYAQGEKPTGPGPAPAPAAEKPAAAAEKPAAANPVVVMTTSKGVVEIELWPAKAPISVKNFLDYVDKKAYDGTIFHRVIKGFMIQGGGFDPDMAQRPSGSPIKNEAENGLSNATGTIAMARTRVVDSATNQFFINTVDNAKLDHKGPGDAFGYCVFGKVISGMDVVKAIEGVATANKGGHGDVPVEPVAIQSIKRK